MNLSTAAPTCRTLNACAARAAPKRVAYAEGEDERVLRAVQTALDEKLVRAILIGRPAVIAARIERAGLLATAYTMEQDFYIGRMRRRHGIELLVPDAAARAEVHRVIFDELCRGQLRDESRSFYRRAVQALADDGARAVVLGCTEICLLLDPAGAACALPLYDSTALHAAAAVDWMLAPATMLD